MIAKNILERLNSIKNIIISHKKQFLIIIYKFSLQALKSSLIIIFCISNQYFRENGHKFFKTSFETLTEYQILQNI